MRSLKQIHVCGAEEEILKHGVVGEQQMWGSCLHLLPREQLIRQARFAGIEEFKLALSFTRRLGRVTDIAAKSDVRGRGKHLPKPLHLVVSEGVHGVQQQGSDPWSQWIDICLRCERGQDRNEEALSLSGTGSGGHNQISAGMGLTGRLLLMRVELSIYRESRTTQTTKARWEDALVNQVTQSSATDVRGGAFKKGTLRECCFARDSTVESLGELLVRKRQQ